MITVIVSVLVRNLDTAISEFRNMTMQPSLERTLTKQEVLRT